MNTELTFMCLRFFVKLHAVTDLPPSSTHHERFVEYVRQITPRAREIERIRDGKARTIEAQALRPTTKKRKSKAKRYCSLCKVTCLSLKLYQDHLNGAKHSLKEIDKRLGPFKCILSVMVHLRRRISGTIAG